VRALLPALCAAAIHLACSLPPNPIVRGQLVTIVIESTAGVPSVTGDFTAWQPRPAWPMERRGWYQFETTLEQDARVEYLIFFGPQDLRVDPRNPHRVPSVGGEASEIAMPAAEAQPETAIEGQPPAGVFDQRRFAANDGERRVVVYRPTQITGPLPIVYFHDGSPAKPIRFSIVTARYDARWLSDGRALRETLDLQGYQQTYREVPEGHNVQTWRAHLDDVLIGLGFSAR
jgi:enterochelin esterase-like enzyme